MGLSRAFVGFSSTDIHYFRLMLAWKKNEHIDFDFADCQLAQEINSNNEVYIKSRCRNRIDMSGTFISLIGNDTFSRHKYVRWEMEVALEKGCRIIGVNLDGSRKMVRKTCPLIIQNVGAIFVPFSPKIVAHALADWSMQDDRAWHYNDKVYKQLGY
jgi:hypothetical protein